jgi:glycosyltransferase involved in cell wall biosynthesis
MPTLALVHDSIGEPSGMGRVVEAMAEVALEADWSVILVASAISPTLRESCTYRHVPSFEALPCLPRQLAWCTATVPVLRRTPADVIHVHSPFLMRWGDLMTCHHLAKPAKDLGVREHRRGVTGALRRVQASALTVVDDLLYRHRPSGTHLSFVSEFLRDAFVSRYGKPSGGWVIPPKAPLWRPVTDDARGRARQRWRCGDGVVVGFLGGVDHRKGFDDALGLANVPGLWPLFAGPGTGDLACTRGRGVGFVEPDDLLEACDVVVAPARFDAAPVAVLQALARGIPVVVTPSTGWARTVDRHGAGIVWNQTSSLGDAVRRAASIPQSTIRPLVEMLGADGFKDRLLSVYEAMAGDQRTRALAQLEGTGVR